MRPALAIPMILIAGLFGAASPASAQFWPGYGYYGDAGVWGAYTSALHDSTSRYIAQSDRLMGERAANQQMTAMQSGIRNTLSSQANLRTQTAMSQQQSNRDWWFQIEQQQLARRRAAGAMGSPATAEAAMATMRQESPAMPQVATDVIPWLPVLCDPRFAAERAIVEAPYRHADGKPTEPTEADYQRMIEAAGQMKTILDQMAGEISAREYLDAGKFLDQLAAEARGRIEKAAAPSAK